MKTRIMYVENKSGQSDRGQAWIGKVEFSKSGLTIYFNGHAFKKSNGQGNHYDIETGEEYWISGIKKNGQDRHWAGGGVVMIDRKIVDEYLTLVDFDKLDTSYELIDVVSTDKNKFKEIENEKVVK